jgi:hypothetical protein
VNTLHAALVILDEHRTSESWETFTGFSRRGLGTVLRRMDECAGDIAKLNRSSIARILFSSAANGSDITAHLLASPKVLRLYAEFVRSLARERRLQPHGKIHTDHTRALLTGYVIDATGQPHDNEVARLLSVVLQRPDLTADSQKDWRYTHPELLRTAAPFAVSLSKPLP